MNILVSCEESQRVTIEFRKRGHSAFSCDISEPSGGHEEWHIQGDTLPLLDGDCSFRTMDGTEHKVAGHWDLLIAFPPCTHLCCAGQRWFAEGKKPRRLQNDAIDFFMKFVNADCEKIAIENPVDIMSTRFRKPSQIIQPYQFGDAVEKKTCLWLKGLCLLRSTNVVDIPEKVVFNSGRSMSKWYKESWNLPKSERAKARSKTFPGIAKAMAEQWG